jgi:AcrR family transcriptional regulator
MGRPQKITNDEILAAARQVFLDQGAGASTADIAERAGISEASIFKRFATKQDLFMAAIGITKLPAWVKELSNKTPTFAIKSELTAICSEMLAFYQEVLPRVLMMMMSPGDLLRSRQFIPPPVRDSQLLAGFLERAIAAGHLRACDHMAVAHMIVGAINNYVTTQTMLSKLSLPNDSSPIFSLKPSEFVHNLIEILWFGIAPEV